MSTQKAPAGWYPIAGDTARYWDGAQWTNNYAPHTPQIGDYSAVFGSIAGFFIPIVGVVVALANMGKRGVGIVWATSAAGIGVWILLSAFLA